ncbi:hypothetical protein [Shewanella pealeana]|uniref:Uncharacterized protein n=1 Tax=Shewanella pealeana (strain ATCC 700345 / ANG-SQ1) TaxID=398579 RepID=A8H6H6_SHEPA|nr:hypothetical protein [Shewanella pealeana]ABV88163.1 hypothetical protein Spea_2845 [Shewanella pealeana ATCC 700345]
MFAKLKSCKSISSLAIVFSLNISVSSNAHADVKQISDLTHCKNVSNAFKNDPAVKWSDHVKSLNHPTQAREVKVLYREGAVLGCQAIIWKGDSITMSRSPLYTQLDFSTDKVKVKVYHAPIPAPSLVAKRKAIAEAKQKEANQPVKPLFTQEELAAMKEHDEQMEQDKERFGPICKSTAQDLASKLLGDLHHVIFTYKQGDSINCSAVIISDGNIQNIGIKKDLNSNKYTYRSQR